MASPDLGDRYETWIAQLVQSGRFATRGAVLREGLRLLEEQEQAKQADLELLRALIREGDESGPAELLDLAAIRTEAAQRTRRGSGTN